jgi:hypothetical protein
VLDECWPGARLPMLGTLRSKGYRWLTNLGYGPVEITLH